MELFCNLLHTQNFVITSSATPSPRRYYIYFPWLTWYCVYFAPTQGPTFPHFLTKRVFPFTWEQKHTTPKRITLFQCWGFFKEPIKIYFLIWSCCAWLIVRPCVASGLYVSDERPLVSSVRRVTPYPVTRFLWWPGTLLVKSTFLHIYTLARPAESTRSRVAY